MSKEKGSARWLERDADDLQTYCCHDNEMQVRLRTRHALRLADERQCPNGMRLFDFMTRLQEIADEMTWRGIRVDDARYTHHDHALRTRIGIASREFTALVQRLTGAQVNPASPVALAKLYFQVLGVEPVRWSEVTGAPSLDEEALTRYMGHPSDVVVGITRQLMSLRRWGAMHRNQIANLWRDPRGVVHPMQHPGGAVSGRWITSRPNLLNIYRPVEVQKRNRQGALLFERDGAPRMHVIHPGLRDMYVPHNARHWWVEADAKQIELRIAAYRTGDDKLARAMEGGASPHVANARDIFKIAPEGQVTARQKVLAKNMVYGIMNGMGPQKLRDTILPFAPAYTLREADYHVKNWFRTHPTWQAWHMQTAALARRQGFIDEPFSGRRRWFWGDIEPEKVYSFLIQTAASEIINRAIERVHPRLRWPSESILLQLHDAIHVSAPDPYRVACILKEEMERPVMLDGRSRVFPVEIKIGKSWAAGVEVEIETSRGLRRKTDGSMLYRVSAERASPGARP